MAASTRNSTTARCAVALLLLLSESFANAAAPDPREQPFDLVADVQNSDFRTDVHELSGNVRLTQGAMSIESEQATAKALQTDHSQWTFERSVHIRTADADLKSNSASAAFVKGQIAEARATGSPAYFEQRGGPPDKQVKGRAGVIEYDFGKGIVTLSQDVWFSYGGNEFRASKVIYNLRDERVVANPDGQDAGRVNITVRPKTGEMKVNPASPVQDPAKNPAPDPSRDPSRDKGPASGGNGAGE